MMAFDFQPFGLALIEQRAVAVNTQHDLKFASFPDSMTVAPSEEVKSWLKFIGTHENGERFSKLLTKDEAFRDFAEASCLNERKRMWFEDIVCEG